ncbi:hypothetical protein MuYL_4200 [Mucilaginibacter xinganensis]|uniref:Uncharacterized protein n=1 Tax=Mucilaginibacter xinganensis TaxID=1234841 RepID=A0A223P1T3_9SPHI|nr:hypothetical protein MuYL_4200 [Mucilaginibacter xinganensis]
MYFRSAVADELFRKTQVDQKKDIHCEIMISQWIQFSFELFKTDYKLPFNGLN